MRQMTRPSVFSPFLKMALKPPSRSCLCLNLCRCSIFPAPKLFYCTTCGVFPEIYITLNTLSATFPSKGVLEQRLQLVKINLSATAKTRLIATPITLYAEQF